MFITQNKSHSMNVLFETLEEKNDNFNYSNNFNICIFL